MGLRGVPAQGVLARALWATVCQLSGDALSFATGVTRDPTSDPSSGNRAAYTVITAAIWASVGDHTLNTARRLITAAISDWASLPSR